MGPIPSNALGPLMKVLRLWIGPKPPQIRLRNAFFTESGVLLKIV